MILQEQQCDSHVGFPTPLGQNGSCTRPERTEKADPEILRDDIRSRLADLVSEPLDVRLIQPGLDGGPGVGGLPDELQQLPRAFHRLRPGR